MLFLTYLITFFQKCFKSLSRIILKLKVNQYSCFHMVQIHLPQNFSGNLDKSFFPTLSKYLQNCTIMSVHLQLLVCLLEIRSTHCPHTDIFLHVVHIHSTYTHTYKHNLHIHTTHTHIHKTHTFFDVTEFHISLSAFFSFSLVLSCYNLK